MKISCYFRFFQKIVQIYVDNLSYYQVINKNYNNVWGLHFHRLSYRTQNLAHRQIDCWVGWVDRDLFVPPFDPSNFIKY